MTPSLSMRAAWQQVADRHSPIEAFDEAKQETWQECAICGDRFPCPDRVTALAQINALNEALRPRSYVGNEMVENSEFRLVPDPMENT